MSASFGLLLAAFAFHDHTKQFGLENAGLLIGAAEKDPATVMSAGIQYKTIFSGFHHRPFLTHDTN